MTPEFKKKCAAQVADTMMAHYENHNIVTDGWECGAEEQGFSEEEIELASTIDLYSDDEFKAMVIEALKEEINNIG